MSMINTLAQPEENKGKAGNVDGEAPSKGSMDMQDAIDAILIPNEAPVEDKPVEDEVTEVEASSAEAATTEASAPTEEEEAAVEASEEEDEVEETEEAEEAIEAEAESQEPEEDNPEEDPEVLFTTADGEDVTLDELKRGSLRPSDYTKKTQEVAESRKAVQEALATTKAYQEEVARNLELALNVVEPQLAAFAKTDWDALAAQDAYEYAEQRALYDQAQARYGQLQQAAQQTVAYAQQQQAMAKDRMLAAERQKLQMALPDMADPVAGRKLANDIREYALGMGLSQEEASGIVDHRLIVALNKARMYDEMSKSQLTASRKKIQKGPKKVIKGGKPQTSTQKQAATAKAKRQALRNTGGIDEAVDWLLT